MAVAVAAATSVRAALAASGGERRVRMRTTTQARTRRGRVACMAKKKGKFKKFQSLVKDDGEEQQQADKPGTPMAGGEVTAGVDTFERDTMARGATKTALGEPIGEVFTPVPGIKSIYLSAESTNPFEMVKEDDEWQEQKWNALGWFFNNFQWFAILLVAITGGIAAASYQVGGGGPSPSEAVDAVGDALLF